MKSVAPTPSPAAIATVFDDPQRPTLVTETEPPFKILAVNSAWTALCGYEEAEVLNLTPSLLQASCTDRVAASSFTRILLARNKAVTTLTNRTKSGCDFTHRLTAKRVTSDNGESVFVAQSTVIDPPAPRTRSSSLLALLVIVAMGVTHHAITRNNHGATLHGIPRQPDQRTTLPAYASLVEPVRMDIRLRRLVCWPLPKERPTVPGSKPGTHQDNGKWATARAPQRRAKGFLRGVRSFAARLLPLGGFLPAVFVANADLFFLSSGLAFASGF